MPKQINVKLGFEADTSQARKQIADLQKSLDGLLSSSTKQSALTGFDKEISNAQQSVLKLKTAINNSLNADTGRLDLSKFNTQLNNSGLTLGQLSKDMNGLGADGQKAFLNLANSIVTAQKPMVESNKLLDNMWTALKNTARWQLSSSLLHGFMGALQGAYGYAQDLNKSLTDIAIVTGRSTDQMAAFAEQANKSAQALSVSTTAYTDAALIYYQQGLSDEEVKARTDITMQMSNVTGESAEHVSSYMTAIWNNFAEGSENLDHFADVITALGAATASSSEEIANGMQQFAAVADTVGLSYEYAATALATVVAQTRQSESTVGNSFRTIFSRLQGLKLGETLEDGTDLNKYSNALATIGVNIKDQNGNLKEMDTILNEIGARWQSLAKDQQVALAQTVGGVRQYTNLIALFDNWDTFQENLETANSSDGALQQQADIYAQSWEAAQKRVKAAWQAIYQDLINDDFFINILNGIEKILHGIDGLIDGLGGIPGVLGAIGTVVTTVFGKQIAEGLRGAQQQLKVFTGTAQAENDAMVAWTNQYLQNNRIKDAAGTGDIPYENLENELLKQKLGLTIELREVYDGLNDAQKQYANSLLESVENQQKLTLEAKATAEAARAQAENAMRNLRASASTQENSKWLTKSLSRINFEEDIDALMSLKNNTEAYDRAYNALIQDIAAGNNLTDRQLSLIQQVVDGKIAQAEADKKVSNRIEVLDNETDQFNQRLQELVQGHHNGYLSTQELIQALENEKGSLDKVKLGAEEYKRRLEELDTQIKKLQGSNQGVFGASFAQSLTNSFKGISQLTMGINSLSSAFDALGNKDLSIFEKIQRFATGVSFGAPSLMMGGKQAGKDISSMYNQIYSYFGQKSANQGIQSIIDENISKKENLNNLINSANSQLDEWEIDEAIAEMENLTKTNETLKNSMKGGLTVWEDLGNIFTGAKTKLLGLVSGFLQFLPYIAAAAAAIYVFKKAWDAWYASTPEGKLEAANKALEEAQQKVSETGEAYKNAKATLDEYADAAERISHMDASSDRADAVAEENDKILELIDNLDAWEKIGTLKYDANGLIELTQAQKDALENDTRREASLAKQAEYQAKINQLTAQADKNYKDEYSGSKINLSRQTGTTTVEAGGMSHEVGLYETKDVTREIADILNNKGLTINSDTNKIQEALEASEKYSSEEIINVLLPAIEQIAANTDKSQEFNELQNSVKGDNAALIANGRQVLGQENLDTTSPFSEVQDAIVQDFVGLTQEQQEIIRNAVVEEGMTLEQAWQEAGLSLEQTIADSTTQMRMHLLDNVMKAGDLQGNLEGQQEAVDWFNSLNEEKLKILGTLEIDEETSFEEIKAQVEELSHQITVKVDADVDEEELANLTDYIMENAEAIDELDDHLKDCEAEAKKVAHAILRFDDAIQDVTENYDEWNKALSSGAWQDAAKYTDDLKDAYGDLLDIDGSVLTDDFVRNTENLDLMKQAIEGNEGAYQELQAIAGQEILTKFGFDDTEAMNKFNEDLAFIQSYDSSVFGNIAELEAGASLNDQAFLDELTNMVNIAGMSAEEAQAYLASMGIDAEVKQVPAETTDVTTDASYWEPATYTTGEPLTTGGEENPGSYVPLKMVSAGHWVHRPSTHTEQASPSAFSLEVTSAHKSSGGGIKFSNASHGGGGSGGRGGGSCFAAGTQVILRNFQKNIEDIEPGDLVLSYNEKTHKNEFSKVVQTMIHNVYEKIYNLFVKNDKLVVTGNHRFLITHNNKQEWIQAEDIRVGDLVLLSTGELCKVSNIDIEKKFLTVYNFEVSNTHNYYVGESHILAHNKGGGGGGSSKKKKEEKHKEPTKNIKEPDRYHNIKEKIEDLNTEMDRLNKNKDRAYGKDRIKWMDEEIKKTEEQIKLTDEYIDEIKSYAKIDKEDLQKKLGSFISDADFDENGVLKDYEGLLAKIQGAFDDNVTAALNKATAEYNAAVDKFNASDQGDDATEEFEKAKEAWDKAKETYDKEKETYEERLKSLKQYEDTINLLQEKEQERIDQLNESYDKKLARTEYKVEISLEINEDDMNYLQWIYDNLGDSADKAADRISLLSKEMKVAQKDIATSVKGIEELFAQNGMKVDLDEDQDGTQLAQQLDEMIKKMREQGGEPNIQKVINQMSEYRDKLMDTYNTMRDLADAATENVVNAYDEWNERLQENLDLMDHYDSVIDTIKEIADLLGEDQLGLGDEQAKAYEQAKLDNQRNAAAIAKDNYDAIAKERERVQKLLETSESETEKKHWEEVLKNLQEAENEAMEEYLSRWRDALRQAEENYQASLARNEKAYQKAMSGGMGTLDMLQEQFDRQKELDDLYLDDYEKYKKLGDITSKINKNLANNPSPMIQEKMKDLLDDVNAKMENGADISEGEATILEKRLALLEAEDQLLAARNAKSAVRMTRDNEGNFSYTYTADTSKIEEAQQNYADKFYELLDYEKQYSDETQGNMLKSWQDFINKRNEILEDDMLSEDERNKAMERLQADYDKMVAYYSDELNMVMEEMSRLKTDDWKDMENILGRLLAGPEDFETDLSKTTLGQLTNAWSDPEGMAKSWRDAADTLYTQDADARAAWVAANEETNRRVDTSTKEFAENYKSTLGEVVKASDDVAKSAETMAEEMPKAMNTVLEEAGNFYQQFGGYLDDLIAKIGNIVNAINEMKRNLAGIDPEYQKKILNGSLPESIKNIPGTEVPVSAATGMYTGEWGASGKLAILHQKELVLNEADTANILKAVDFIRGIPQFSGVLNVNNNVDYSKLAAVGATDLQQQVHIDASFPNVESHTEIELALNNLINSASQYVNRK